MSSSCPAERMVHCVTRNCRDQESAERGNSSDTVDAEPIVSRDRSAPEATAC